jgi:predicted small integral membrane protein
MQAFWVSLPFGVLVALVLLINNTRDIGHDRQKGIITIPILIGQRNGFRLYLALVIVAYMGILWMSVFGPLDLWSLIVFVSLPLAIRLLKQVRYEIPVDADADNHTLCRRSSVVLQLYADRSSRCRWSILGGHVLAPGKTWPGYNFTLSLEFRHIRCISNVVTYLAQSNHIHLIFDDIQHRRP